MSTEPQVVSTRRLLGLDGNPLRRFSDRLQSAILLLVFVGCIGALPVAVQAAQAARHGAAHTAQHEASRLHPVLARLLETAHGVGPTQSGTTFVRAAWTAPSGAVRTARIEVAKGAHEGSITTVWVDEAGIKHKSPKNATEIQALAILVGVGTYLGVVLALFVVYGVARWILERMRLARWAAEWARLAPR